MIENTGSFLIFIIVDGLRLLLFYLILKYCKKGHKIRDKCREWAVFKREDLIWAGSIDFFNELYLSIAFSLGINSSYMRFGSASEAFNDLFAIVIGVIFLVVPPI